MSVCNYIKDARRLERERLKFTVNYKLRIGYLYHGKPPQRLDDRADREQLENWKWNMKDSRVCNIMYLCTVVANYYSLSCD